MLQGDFGTSLSTQRPVLVDFMALFPATLELAVTAMVIAVIINLFNVRITSLCNRVAALRMTFERPAIAGSG